MPPGGGRFGERVVGEGGVRSDEHVVLQPHTVPQLDAALHGDPIAHHDVALHEHSVTDVAVGADDRTREHVGERPDTRSRADLGGFAERVGMDVGHAERPAPVHGPGRGDSYHTVHAWAVGDSVGRLIHVACDHTRYCAAPNPWPARW